MFPLKERLPVKFELPHRPTAGCEVTADPVVVVVRFLGKLGEWYGANRFLVLCQARSFHPAFAAEMRPADTQEGTSHIFRQRECLRHRLVFSRTFRNRHVEHGIRFVIDIVRRPSRFPVEQLDPDPEIAIPGNSQILFLHDRQCNRQFTRFQQLTGNAVIGVAFEIIVFAFEIKRITVFYGSPSPGCRQYKTRTGGTFLHLCSWKGAGIFTPPITRRNFRVGIPDCPNVTVSGDTLIGLKQMCFLTSCGSKDNRSCLFPRRGCVCLKYCKRRSGIGRYMFFHINLIQNVFRSNHFPNVRFISVLLLLIVFMYFCRYNYKYLRLKR